MTRLLLPVLLYVLLPGDLTARGEEKQHAADLLPARCIAFAELTSPPKLLDTLQDHQIYSEIKQLDEYKAAVADPKYIFFQTAVAHVESKIEMSWREAFDMVFDGGLTVAFDPATDGAVALLRATNADTLKKTATTLIRMARIDAAQKGNKDAIPEDEYRGFTVYGQAGGRIAIVDRWLILTNKDDLGKEVIDRYLDGTDGALAEHARFQTARSTIQGTPTLWSYVDLTAIRDSGEAPSLEHGRADNPGVELLVGGVLSNLVKTPFVTASLYVEPSETRLTLATPHQADWVDESRDFYFGPAGKGAAPPLLRTESTAFSLSTYRNISQMWLRAGDLFDAKANDELAKADSNLSTLFAGKDFGEDVLGLLAPQLQILVARQDFASTTPRPAIQLPAFALVGTLTDAETGQPELRRSFQSIIGFLNVVGAMQGNPQLDQDVEIAGDARIYKSGFIPEPEEEDSTRARIHFNFSPSLAFAGDRFVLSSTQALARELATAPATTTEPNDGSARSNVNTAFAVTLPVVRRLLEDNREQLIAQNMLEEGHSREEAEHQIGLFLSALGWFGDLSLSMATTDNALMLELAVDTPVGTR